MTRQKTSRPAVTQKEVATLAGVSQMTVSYALRGSELVKPATRKRVLKTARELGYRPNTSAVAMRQGRSGCVAIVESTTRYRSSFFGGALFDGIESVLGPQDIHINVARLSDDTLTSERYVPKILREYMADGLLINYFADIPPKLIELIDRFQVPATWINSKQAHNCVYLDDYRGGWEATQHLIQLGHKKIAYADFHNRHPQATGEATPVHYSIVDRRRGYEDAMAASRLEPIYLHDQKSKLLPHEALDRARHCLAGDDYPTGIVAYRGPDAMQLMHAAVERGIDIPRDLSIIAFDDFDVADTGIRFTMMQHRFYDVGVAASRMLLERIEATGPATDLDPRVQSFRMVLGDTTGAAPA